MTSKSVMIVVIHDALQRQLPMVVDNLIIAYYYPTIEFHDLNLLHDICRIWLTKKGLNRRHLFPINDKAYCDGLERHEFKSEVVQRMFDIFDHTDKSNLTDKKEEAEKTIDAEKDANDDSDDETAENDDEYTDKELAKKLRRYQHIKEALKLFLKTPIIYGPRLWIQRMVATPFAFENVGSIYRKSAHRDKWRVPMIDFRDNDNEEEEEETNKQRRERLSKIKADKKKKQLEIMSSNPMVLPTTIKGKMICITPRLHSQNFFTLEDVLCACDALKERHVGLRHSTVLKIIGITSCGDPIVATSFDEFRDDIDEENCSAGHIFMD